jgi:MoaA/NifB/PqqE/SkfB family radical SAM enzyme
MSDRAKDRHASRPDDLKMAFPAMNDVPRKIYLEITTECNLNCEMCIRHAWRQDSRVMTQATFDALRDQLRALPSVSVLNFGGFGEPLLHPEFFGFVRRAKQDGLQVETVTNGVLLDRKAGEALVDLELDRLFVSLDGVEGRQDAAFHAESTSLVHANLQSLYRTKLIRRLSRPEVTAVFVASRRNIHQLPAVRRKALELGLSRIVVTNLIPYRAELSADVLYGNWTTNRCNETPSPWNPAIEFPRVDPYSDATRILDYLALHGSRVSVDGATISGGAMDCRFIREGRLAVDADGQVSPCLPLLHAYSYYFRNDKRTVRPFYPGNINDVPLGEIWRTPRYVAFRERVRRFDFSPCIDCGGCDLRDTNEEDCFGSGFPSCGDCLWAAGVIQCP